MSIYQKKVTCKLRRKVHNKDEYKCTLQVDCHLQASKNCHMHCGQYIPNRVKNTSFSHAAAAAKERNWEVFQARGTYYAIRRFSSKLAEQFDLEVIIGKLKAEGEKARQDRRREEIIAWTREN